MPDDTEDETKYVIQHIITGECITDAPYIAGISGSTEKPTWGSAVDALMMARDEAHRIRAGLPANDNIQVMSAGTHIQPRDRVLRHLTEGYYISHETRGDTTTALWGKNPNQARHLTQAAAESIHKTVGLFIVSILQVPVDQPLQVAPTASARRLEYVIYEYVQSKDLERDVNAELKKGGTLVGSPFTRRDISEYGNITEFICQAMMMVVVVVVAPGQVSP